MTTNNPSLSSATNVDKMDIDQLKAALPNNLRSSATQELLDKINTVSSDPTHAKHIRENFLSYANVLKEGRFKTQDYLNAVSYVSYKLMGYNNKEAYEKTFPQRYTDLIKRGASGKDISAYVSIYHKGKMVNMIMEQTLVPVFILNQHIFQEAINTQANLMHTAASEKVRSDAADSLMNHLKKPESKDMNLNIGLKADTGLAELNNTLVNLASAQKKAIQDGRTTEDIAAESIYTDAEFEEIG